MQPGETPPSAASFVQIPHKLMEIQGLLGSVPGDSPVLGFCSGILGPDSPTPLLREIRLQDRGLILRELLKGSTAALI